MYTLYNDFKYKNTYLRVCIPYIMTLNIRIHTSSCMYTLYDFKYKNTYLRMYTLYKNKYLRVYNDFKYKNTYLRVCIPYIMTLNIRIHTFMYVYLI